MFPTHACNALPTCLFTKGAVGAVRTWMDVPESPLMADKSGDWKGHFNGRAHGGCVLTGLTDVG